MQFDITSVVPIRLLGLMQSAHDSYIWDIAFTSNGAFAATASDDGWAKMWKMGDECLSYCLL